METLQASLNSYPRLVLNPARCSVCGFEGIYGIDIIDAGYVDSTGRDSVRCECRDIERCLDRKEKGGDKGAGKGIRPDASEFICRNQPAPKVIKMNIGIKFRAWVKNKKAGHEMFNVVMISWVGKEVILSGKGGSIGLEDCELLQYTGLKDKRGKEIYEGDILKCPQPLDDNLFEVGHVYWCSDSAGYYVETNLSNDELSAFTDGEVIGNIYENPELLK